MLFHTHILAGIAFFFFLSNFFPAAKLWLFLGILLGSILPDIDEQHSKVNRWAGMVGILIAFFAKHRGFFHSLPCFLGLTFLLQVLGQPALGWGLLLGYASHIILDGLTRQGIAPFWPFSSWKVRGPFRVGSFAEQLFFLALVIFVVVEVL
ncbi:MAG: metal-dependent hydrolase [Nanoarchaeota archaeon]|nr:metal-dependent hydrolase [Nanoarchaeota archaeon]